MEGDLLDAEHLALLLVPNPTTGSTDWFRSLGLRIDLEEGEVNVGHQGKSIGYRGDWSTRAGRETTIVVLHNGGWVGARSLTNRLWDEHDRARP